MEQEKIQLKRFLMGYDLLKIYEIHHTKNIKLGLEHLAIIDWFTCFQGTNKMKYKIINDEIWYWCSFEKIISDMPILGISNKQVISRLIKALATAEIFDYYFDKKGGSKTYIKLGSKYSELVSAEKMETTFDTSIYKHKKKEGYDLKVEPPQLKSNRGYDLKVERGSTKKSYNRLVINRLVINSLVKIKTTTKHKSTFKFYKSDIKKLEKFSSSSSCEEIKKIEQLLSEKSLNNRTCENILNAVKENSLTLEKVKETFEFAKTKNKGIGYIVDSLKFNWDTSLVAKPVMKNSDSIEKEKQFIENRKAEKEEASKQVLQKIELTPELEKELRQKVMDVEGIKLSILEDMKIKSKNMYINTLKRYATT